MGRVHWEREVSAETSGANGARGVQVSPFGVIPKSEPGRWRLILDLSSPSPCSVNDGIAKELCSLSYLSIDEVADRIHKVGRGVLMAKFDLKTAYQNVPVHPDDRMLLGIMWRGQLYVDKVLPFGLRSAPKIFNTLADALAYMIRERGVDWLEHYLDDYVLVVRVAITVRSPKPCLQSGEARTEIPAWPVWTPEPV